MDSYSQKPYLEGLFKQCLDENLGKNLRHPAKCYTDALRNQTPIERVLGDIGSI